MLMQIYDYLLAKDVPYICQSHVELIFNDGLYTLPLSSLALIFFHVCVHFIEF